MDEQQNRRRYFRVTIGRDTLFHLNVHRKKSSWGRCMLIDVSAGGAQIVTPLKFPINESDVFATIQISLHETSYTIDADIIWGKKSNRVYRYGLKWKTIDPEQQQDLLQKLLELQTKKVQINVR
ncbi:PilZ domain-containing protein [Fodinisporobacter ferrooxydans]|uniref:PilZ domain-containing protein n=1 Tax=Fodinisporobacter ferrooxydans TaxID=2901836 RepID=A0ABY4CDK3_9BACL|nr:PilZ domain-containing protein [Alicyclobacillaceae bacterium MYW30-H2]